MRVRKIPFLGMACGLAAGCTSLETLRAPDRVERGLVIILPGIEGPSIWNHNIAMGLAEGGVNCGIVVHDWSAGVAGGGILRNLRDLDRNRAEALEVVRRLVEYRRTYGDRPIVLVGHSGGAGLALLAAERLCSRSPIDGLVLLAAAVSPDHDLTTALRHVRKGIWNYYSRYDTFVLLGTVTFGTVDRKHAAPAGAVGFRNGASRPAGCATLYQIEWNARMIEAGNWGDHFGWAARDFVRRYLAPVVMNAIGASKERQG